MDPAAELRFAALTAAGRGALCGFAVWGPAVAERLDDRFVPAAGRSLAATPLEQPRFGRWQLGAGLPSEEVVVVRRDRERVELFGHGGRAARAALADSLRSLPAKEASDDELLRDRGPAVAEAARQLRGAMTRRTAGHLLDQRNGALVREIAQIRQCLASDPEEAARRLTRLLDSSDVGQRLTTPWRIALVGRPNVGKSSLLNAMLGYARAIVYDQPGTTRDLVSASTAVNGWPIDFVDTPGIRDAADPLEREAIRRAERQLATADRRILVVDASAPWSQADAGLLERMQPDWLVWSKTDRRLPDPARPVGIPTAAISGVGVPELLNAVAADLVPRPPELGEPLLIASWQLAACEACRVALERDDRSAAAAALDRLLGRARDSAP